MAIPDFQSLFLPLLEFARDGIDHTNKEAVEALARIFDLTGEDRRKLLPSAAQPTFDNRVVWTKTYLNKAGLLILPRRGVFRITGKGLALLKNPPEKLDVKYLKQCREFLDFHTFSHKTIPPDKTPDDIQGDIEDRTPEELLSIGYNSLRYSLVSDLLEGVKQMSPSFFERMVVELLLKMGYGGAGSESGIAIGKSGDEGIDGVISEDKLGLDVIYIQAKRWEAVVGRPEIQKFVGALQGKRAKKGVFITTSSFTNEAREFTNMVDIRVILIDGQRLANLMIDHNVGVALKDTYDIKKIDSDFFIEE